VVQSHAEKLADRMVPYSFLLSGLAYVLTGNALRAASALMVDYSCAIKLSVPLTIRTAMMDASRRGVLIKGGRFIEKMARADVFVLDKTGTLTEARPDVVDVIALNGYRRDFILRAPRASRSTFRTRGLRGGKKRRRRGSFTAKRPMRRWSTSSPTASRRTSAVKGYWSEAGTSSMRTTGSAWSAPRPRSEN
jgi:magnesium-transporting ATPase (P-type)